MRRRLVVSLWVVVVLVGASSAIFAYKQAELEAKILLDDQLMQIAGFVVSRGVHMPRNRDDDESLEIAVWEADGHQSMRSTPFMKTPHMQGAGFTQVRLGGVPYRLYAVEYAGRHVEVAQPMDTRDDAAEGAALASLLPVAVLLPVLALVIALVIRTLLQPVREVAAAVSRRAPLASGALHTGRLPSEIIPLVEEINRLLQRQSAAVEREREFIADAAHALRTPLTALQLQSDVLKDASTPEQREARLAELREGIRRTSRLGAQLLSLARQSMDASASDTCDLYSACRAAAAALEPLCRERGVSIGLPPVMTMRCAGSAEQLDVVLGNLLDNALRYAPGGTSIDVSMSAHGGDVTLEIGDRGPGLPEGELEKVFSRFYRAPGDRTEGSGLGLAIVRSIVTSLGGTVRLVNREGGGLCAQVTLPEPANRIRASHREVADAARTAPG